MTRIAILEPRFVDAMPATLDDGVLYVSMLFNIVLHQCCCGCGSRVVTPLSPVEWRLEYDGRTVSLYPSIGNHQYRCKSHYWIRRNRVEWSDAWTTREIDEGRAATHRARRAWYDGRPPDRPRGASTEYRKFSRRTLAIPADGRGGCAAESQTRHSGARDAGDDH